MNKSSKYDVAFSFAGEDRIYVEQVAKKLLNEKISVFYDKFEEAELWGKNLYDHLSDIYKNKARYTVIFISSSYAKKNWCNHELKSAQAKAFEENIDNILPAKFDDTVINGILPTVGFIDLRHKTPDDLALLIYKKLVPEDKTRFHPKETDDYIGQIIKGYRIEELIGQGGFGKVYKANHCKLNQKIAIKISYPATEVKVEAKDQFRRLAILKTFNHKNIAKIYDFGFINILNNEHIYIFSEYIDGSSLREFVGPYTSFEAQKQIENFFRNICEGLLAAHSYYYKPSAWGNIENIIHGDIKPGNIIIDTNNKIKIIDFDQLNFWLKPDFLLEQRIKYEIQDGFTVDETLILGGNMYGTPGYIPPDFLEGESSMDEKTDIYSLGITLFELFTGIKPPVFQRRRLHESIDSLIGMAGYYQPSWFKAVISKTICDRLNRFNSINEIITIIDRN